MVALRNKKHNGNGADNTAPASAATGASPEGGEGVKADTSVGRGGDVDGAPIASPAAAPAAGVAQDDALKARLAELAAAEAAQQAHYQQQREQISRTFQGDHRAPPQAPHPQAPHPQQQAHQAAIERAKEEIAAWLAQRPGITANAQAVAIGTRLAHEGFVAFSPAWRKAMEQAGFGRGDYRPESQSVQQHQPSLARATEPAAAAADNDQHSENSEADETSRYVSAPVTRDAPSLSSGQRPYNLSPNSVRLSPDEIAIAKASGQSPIEYARQKLRLQQMKRDGLIQD